TGTTAAPAGTTATTAPTSVTMQVAAAAWHLSRPLSRAVALPAGNQLVVLGGLASGDATTPAVSSIDPSTGAATGAGTLADPVHDAAGAVVGGRDVVFGGGAAKVVATVQAGGQAGGGPGVRIGRLPTPRADLAVATVNGRTVIVGGYDGVHWVPDVLATTDGTTFTRLAALPQPVRYPAVAVLGGTVYVIGGELPSGGDATTIQSVDPATGSVQIVGHLATGISHAAAVVLGGKLYVLGGRSGGHVSGTVSVDPATAAATPVAQLPVAVSDMAVATVGGTTYLLGGEDDAGHPVASVATVRLGPSPAASAAGPPFSGHLLIADRGNNRLLVVDASKNVVWEYPSASAPAPPQGFYFPDDAFFAKHGTAIITNQEDQNTIIELAYPSGSVIASYGHPNRPGAAPGYLDQPDDAYLLADGRVTVADAKNCRLVFLTASFTFQSAIGTGRCAHDPPRALAYPNGDTPLANGNFLVSEITGSFIDELRPDGSVVWSLHLPIVYPSDPQQLGPDLYLVADYAAPGALYEFTREGAIVWSYRFTSGEAALDHPSLAEQLPNGDICVNDDFRDRVVIIDPTTKQIVWQYGQTDAGGTGPGQLHIPDGFDLLAPDNSTPTHPQTG
ncbi:MAG TPA: hypothetical protein VGI06_04910, partial [Acidimicrobiales bacterium]